MPKNRSVVPGSARRALPDVQTVGPVPAATMIDATLVLRRRADPGAGREAGREAEQAPARGQVLSRAELAARFGADPADVDAVRGVLAAAGITVRKVDAASRRVRISGPASAINQLCGTTLQQVSVSDAAGTTHLRHRTGELSLPAELDGVVTAVLGLDDRPQGRPHFRVAEPAEPDGPDAGGVAGVAAPAAAGRDTAGPTATTATATTGTATTETRGSAATGNGSYTPPQLGVVYRMPPGTDGSGQVLSIIELGGGFRRKDLQTYFRSLGITMPKVRARGVDGARNKPGTDPTGPDGEVMLDIEVAGALAPAATIKVYFAPNTDAGFLDAVAEATHDRPTPTAISISWGQSEDAWTGQARTAMDQAFADASMLGITVTAAAGDDGSDDRVADGAAHTDFPASSPHALACGGTSLIADPSGGTVSSETVWNNGPGRGATGGGVSDDFALPSWQAGVGVPARAGAGGTGRGVPDVAGDADPQTGYQVLIDGKQMVFGGTSAVAPLWAALICRLVQALGRPLGQLQPTVYAGVSGGVTAAGFRDITAGNNGAYAAGPGWDACTGLGVPVGTDLLTALGSKVAPAAP